MGRKLISFVAPVWASTQEVVRDLVVGIKQEMLRHSDYIFDFCNVGDRDIARYLNDFAPVGMIGHLGEESFANALRKFRTPCIDIAGCLKIPGITRVMCDQVGLGSFAAEYLCAMGFTHFGFIQIENRYYSSLRLRGFNEVLQRRGKSAPHVLSIGNVGIDQLRRPDHWLRKLPLPIAIWTSNDMQAMHLLHAARRIGINVPGELSLLGCDNELIYCVGETPALSTLKIDGNAIGKKARFKC